MATQTFEQRVKEARSKAEMTEWVAKMYAQTERVIEPLRPFIFIRTLPRSTISTGGIILPEKQNKPNIEAIVLAVYKPYWEKVDKVSEKGEHFDISVYTECDVKVGDHIVLPHHVGLPDSFLDPKDYRLIREDDAVCVLHYREKGEAAKELMDFLSHEMYASASIPRLVERLQEHYDVIKKEMYSRITSGV